jgi:cold shock CspA family protein
VASAVYGLTRASIAQRVGRPARPADLHGKEVSGRIARIQFGQGQGFIRMPDARDVYFHRADLRDRRTFNDLRVGDRVTFELLDDPVSGARAIHVRRQRPSR